ncbi:MAG: tRNA (guanosine(46)-N7)-methyltransferase TrmB [Desulfitobacteriaceae bacterium]|nr:tRNA (guanosine(46)-N7)-methyltransferase TrmB [Desulfitobacteriaceae bacterium]MDD4752653.1 tRNA (guanosine(46)-N7)-methyltransferase TrmB [Desulfitobacteriaceae bacterium]
MRLRKIPGIEKKLESYPNIVILNPSLYKNNWHNYFGNSHPIHLELGMGRGKFITALAAKYPDINFIGMEYKPELILKAVQRMTISRRNAVFLLGNANNIPDIVAPREISRIYLNFSDPWPKKRHAKRRLTSRGFLERYKQILAPGAEIHLKTDNRDFFQFSLNEFANCGFYLKNISLDLHKDNFLENITTEYEERFLESTPIFRCVAVHPGNDRAHK